jgi:hypothetical protein
VRKTAVARTAISDVILAGGANAVGPLLQVVPIVFSQVPNPVSAGYIESLAREIFPSDQQTPEALGALVSVPMP